MARTSTERMRDKRAKDALRDKAIAQAKALAKDESERRGEFKKHLPTGSASTATTTPKQREARAIKYALWRLESSGRIDVV